MIENNQILRDYKNCIKQIKFWNRIKKDKNYENLFSYSEIEELINYYKDMKKYLEKDINEIEKEINKND